jgi:protein gp37
MAENSKIEWTHHTFNAWWGCVKVSDGCKNCYAETFSKRTGNNVWGPKAERRFFGDKHWAEPLKWNEAAKAAGERHRVFCGSMCDICEKLPEDHPSSTEMNLARHRLRVLINDTPHLDWLLLTKRPENILPMFFPFEARNPAHNVWWGTSVENQDAADARIPYLLQVPATVRFLSCEPLLGPVDLRGEWVERERFEHSPNCRNDFCALAGGPDDCDGEVVEYPSINWVIAGGESGAKARPPHPNWFKSLRDQCAFSGIAFHFKQWGEWAPNQIIPGKQTAVVLPDATTYYEPNMPEHCDWPCACEICYCARVGKGAAGRLLDGREWDEFPRVESEVSL